MQFRLLCDAIQRQRRQQPCGTDEAVVDDDDDEDVIDNVRVFVNCLLRVHFCAVRQTDSYVGIYIAVIR